MVGIEEYRSFFDERRFVIRRNVCNFIIKETTKKLLFFKI